MMLYLFGTNFGCDMHDYPTRDMDDPTAKSFERAISYLPIFVDDLATVKLRLILDEQRDDYTPEEYAYIQKILDRKMKNI